MDRDALAARIDHTVLGPETTPADVRTTLDEARERGMNVCVPPCYVPLADEHAPETTVVTVVGFPHGQHAPGTKCDEATRAWQDGADELDVVINVGRLRAGEDDVVRAELNDLAASVPTPVKAIVETALLSESETRRAAVCARDADVDMLKTSTGFAGGGATVEDVRLLAEYLPVKASGGIDSYEAAMAMLDAGAERIGASRGVEILDGAPEADD